MLTRDYDPWGNPAATPAPDGYAFTGREWDAETGLYYYRTRYYDPAAGRFASEDGLRFDAGSNFYSYVDNNPAKYSDPYGLLKVCCRPVKHLSSKCHCWILLSNTETLGAYRFGPILQKIRDHTDDRPTPAGSTCKDIPLGPCGEQAEQRVIDEYNRQPESSTYGPANTSNTPVSRALRVVPYLLPKCATGR